MHLCGVDPIHAHDFFLLRLVQGEHARQTTHRRNDAVSLKAVLAHLAQIGGMAHREHPPMHERFHRHRRREIEMMAQHDIGSEPFVNFFEHPGERSRECLRHGRRHVAVARGRIGHLVRHTRHMKRQGLGVEANGTKQHALRKVGRIIGGNARHHRDIVPRSNLAAHRFRQIDAAAGAIGFLGGDVKNPHIQPLENASKSGPRRSRLSKARFAYTKR